jgi:hypothetical protein
MFSALVVVMVVEALVFIHSGVIVEVVPPKFAIPLPIAVVAV